MISSSENMILNVRGPPLEEEEDTSLTSTYPGIEAYTERVSNPFEFEREKRTPYTRFLIPSSRLERLTFNV